MDTTSLTRLQEAGCVLCRADGLSVTVDPAWVVAGEDRLSYTTLVRLIECCREHHWAMDILPHIGDSQLDSICRSVCADFRSPIGTGTVIDITYRVSNVSERSYSLEFSVRTPPGGALCAELSLVSVFYDPLTRRSVQPPMTVLDHLRRACVY